MPVHSHLPHYLNFLPLFMGLRERNVTFVIDTSESMHCVLGSAKHLLIQALVAKASLRDSLFNLIGFSHKAVKWRERMVACAPDSVCEAQHWIHTLSCTPGRDLLGALAEAFSDPFCRAVHLLTNDLPDNPDELLKEVSGLAKACPVHVFYLSDKRGSDHQIQSFLQYLALSTRGRCYSLSLSSTGVVEQVRPLNVTEHWTSGPYNFDAKFCSANGVLNTPPSQDTHAWHQPSRCPANSHSSCSMWRKPECSSQLGPGTRVLAQRELDSFYYLGTIKEEVQGRRGVFLVHFDRPVWAACPCESLSWQQTSLVNMVPHADAHQHSVLPGDKVLAPRDLQLRQYAPASVLCGAEIREPLGTRNTQGLQVLFWNGQTATVPGDMAVWISPTRHERIVRELQCSPPPPYCRGDVGCPVSPCCSVCCSYGCLLLAPPCSCSYRQWWPLPPSPCHMISLRYEGGNKDREELERKVDLQLKELEEEQQSPSACSSCSAGGESEDTHKVEVMNQAVNTDLSLLYKPASAPPARPDWKYWKRSHPEPQHKTPSETTHRKYPMLPKVRRRAPGLQSK